MAKFTSFKEFQEKLKDELEIDKLVTKVGKKTYSTAKKIAHDSLHASNEALASSLEYLLNDIGHKKQFYDFLNFIPSKIRKYSRVFLPFLLMAMILLLPLDIPSQIRKTLAMFVCIAFLWGFESVPMVITALLIPVLIVGLGLGDQRSALVSFSNPVIYLLFGGLVLAEAIRKHSLDKRLANFLLSKSGGSARRILLIFMTTSALLGMWMSNTATIALLVPVVISIVSQLKADDKQYISALVLSIGVCSSIGGMAAITGSTPNAITAAFISEQYELTFFDWMRIGLPIAISCFILSYFAFIVLFRIRKDKKIYIKRQATQPLDYNQRKTLAIFVPTILMWIFGQKVALSLGLPPELFSATIISLLAVCLLFIFRVLSWSDIQLIPWEILLLVGGGLSLGKVIVETGTSNLIADFIRDHMVGLSPLLLVILIMYLSIFLANFVNNTSAVIILVPVLMDLASSLGLNPMILALAASHATAISFVTPISIPAFSIIYSTNLVTRKDMVKTGLAIGLLGSIVVSAVLLNLNWWWT